MNISVVLATYNRSASLLITLETFSRLVIPPFLTWELVVVDNNSSDSTGDVIQRFAKESRLPMRYIFEPTQGRSAALNRGIAEASGVIVVFTDDDVLIHPDWLAQVQLTFDRFECDAVAGRVVPLWNHPKPDWLEVEGQLAIVNFELGDEFKEINFPPLGANSAFRKDLFAKHGLFRLDLGVNGSEHTITCDDTEFGERLTRAGAKIVYCPTAIVYHPVDPKRTTKKYFTSWYYYNGVSLTRMTGLPSEGVSYFGVPRWFFRRFLIDSIRWQLTFNGIRRFRQKLKVCRSLGKIAESYRLSHASRSSGGPRTTASLGAR